ncbi:MAG: hypothetical protein ACE37K_18025 [Planctomycetota bacterium]
MRSRGLHTTSIVALAALLASCGGGGGGGDTIPIQPPIDTVLAEASIGPAGGTVRVDSGENEGLELTVPAGAVAVPTSFRLLLSRTSSDVPSAFPVYRFEPESLDFHGQNVTVTLPASDAFFLGGTPALTVFSRERFGAPWSALLGTTVDVAARRVSVTTDRLGDMVAWTGNLHRLFTQQNGFVDPATDANAEFVAGVQVLVDNGSIPRQVGRGSLASFWNSSTTDNVIILHGALGSPLDFLGDEDFVENLALTHDNVVLFSYPSARGVAYAANELYDLIQANRKPGFGCRIVGHSLGALIGRYLLERSPTDVTRAGYQVGDPSLVPIVDKLILVAPPNAGAAGAVGPFALLESVITPDEAYLLQAADDLSERPGSLPFEMNASYVDNATRYHVIYGDLGGGTDGVVPVASATALPVGASETSTMFVAQHDDLHRLATSLGIAVWMGTLLQVQ